MQYNREAEIESFLRISGFAGAERKKIAGDASFRKYERITTSGKSYILMDAPPEKEDVKPFLAVTEYLAHHDFSAPIVIASNAPQGLLLLEDLGDDLFSRYLQTKPAEESMLYLNATSALLKLHQTEPMAGLAPYNHAIYMRESMLFAEWYLPSVVMEARLTQVQSSFRDAIDACLRAIPLQQSVTVLRDYHADNLIWLPEREGIKRIGLLDFQDALAGAPEYDLVSMLEDARRDVSANTRSNCLTAFTAHMNNQEREAFAARYALLGMQRNLKIIGIFHRLHKRDGKAHYLNYLPRVWNHLRHDLTHSLLQPMQEWIAKEKISGRR